VLRIRATSRVLAVLGDPVAHSVSPEMHNAAIAALGLQAVYVALRVPPAALPAVLDTCPSTGLAGNLTIPLKEIGARHLARLTPLARAVGAVNTFWPDGEAVEGDNTDVAGVAEALEALDAPAPWLVCGTGGSARAVAAAAVRRQVPLVVRSRDPERAAAFVAWTRDLAVALELGPIPVRADDGRQTASTIVNATPVGLSDDAAAPVEEARWRAAAAALDLAYRPGETPWIRAARAAGLRAADGRVVLVAQGARAFERFFPGTRAPREVMRAAVARALAP
jgi:shikimate dehydrogenase